MAKVTNHGWQLDASNAATPTGPVVKRDDRQTPSLKRGSLESYKATPERQNEFAQNLGSELIICLTLPPPKKDK